MKGVPQRVQNHGQARWRVDFGRVGGARRVRFFKTKTAAKRAMAAHQTDARAVGDAWSQLPPRQRARVLEVLGEMSQAGVTLWALWDAYQKGQVAVATRTAPTLAHAVEQLVAAKRAGNRRPRYVQSLASYLGAFIRGRETQALDQVSAAHLVQWFSARGEAPSTQRSNLGRISALFEFGRRQGWVAQNPCRQLDTVTVETARPVVLTVEQARRATLWVAENLPAFLAYWVLGLFAGIRPEELRALKWADIDLEGRRVRLTHTKDRRARIVPLERNAAAWLGTVKRAHRRRIAPAPSTLKRWRARVAAGAGFVWGQDILRKTAATYWLARYPDAGKVSLWLGNSPVILLRHYRALATPAQARAFFSIAPGPRGGKVIRLVGAVGG